MPELPLGAIIAFDFEKWDVREEIALLHRADARRVQIYRNILQNVTPAHILEVLDEAGLTVDSLHAYIELEMLDGPPFDLSAEDPEVRQSALRIARSEAAYARELGCRDVIVHPVGPGDTAKDAWRRDTLTASAEELVRIAERAGVRFLLENMPPDMFGASAKVLRRVVDVLDSPHLGLAYDCGHATIAGDPLGVIRTMGDRLWGVHLHDNDGKEDGHFLPGMGVVPFEDVARALAEVRFRGTFMLEIYRDTAEVRRDLTPERLAYINRLRRLASGLPG
jgi:sugar phosphate isomerase/epimerase